MRYEVIAHPDAVELQVIGTGTHTAAVLASMQDCQAGQCSCPTDQYDRIQDMQVRTGDDEVSVSLHPLPGEHLDVTALSACLDYTIEKAESI